jgi:hypothetical protein
VEDIVALEADVVVMSPDPESKISPPNKSGTLSKIIDAVTGSVPRLDDEPKFDAVIGSRKISGVLTCEIGPVKV